MHIVYRINPYLSPCRNTQLQMFQQPHQKTVYIEPDRRESRD